MDLKDINIILGRVNEEMKSASNNVSNDSEEEESEVVTGGRNGDENSYSDGESATDDSVELTAEQEEHYELMIEHMALSMIVFEASR